MFSIAIAAPAATSVPASASASASAPVAFDLPAQPLRGALEQYDTATGISVLYPSDLAEGRVSFPVRGSYTPEAALRLLIEGTGLSAHAVGDRAFVLRPSAVPAALPSGGPVADAPLDPYDALVQQSVLQALCARIETRMGDYRAALALRVDGAGRIAQARLLDSTGDTGRDSLIPGLLRGAAVGAPPRDTSRAFVILILPRPGQPGQPCASAP